MHDARWILARHAAGQMQGDRAAMLSPERRRELVDLGTRLGLRSFDSNLVLAIVQDAAREGEAMVGPEAQSRLTLVRSAVTTSRWDHGRLIFMAAALATGVTLLAINWLRG
jgi:hypothetical protein